MSNAQAIQILYIEDDKVAAIYVKRQLNKHGYVLELARNGKEGLTKIKDQENSFDLVAIDYHLPDMDGLQVLRSLAESQS